MRFLLLVSSVGGSLAESSVETTQDIAALFRLDG